MTRRVVLLTLGVTSLVVIAFLAPLLSLVRDVAASQATVQASVQAQSAAALVNLDPTALASTLQRQPNTTIFTIGPDGRVSKVTGAPAQETSHTASDVSSAGLRIFEAEEIFVPLTGRSF